MHTITTPPALIQPVATRVAYEFKKNGREVVRATIGEYAGQSIIALWVFTATTDGAMVPTRKGLSISRSALPDLAAAIDALQRETGGANP
jgi:hypothetical protein